MEMGIEYVSNNRRKRFSLASSERSN